MKFGVVLWSVGAIAVLGMRPAAAEAGASYRLVAFTGQPAPGGGVFESFNSAQMAADGSLVFNDLSSFHETLRVFAGRPGAIRQVYRLNQSAGLDSGLFYGASISDQGEVAFATPTIAQPDHRDVFIESGTGLQKASVAGIFDFGFPVFATRDLLAVKVTGYFSPGDVDLRSGLMVGPPGQMQLVLKEGDAAPGFPRGYRIYEVSGYAGPVVDLNAAGDAALIVSIKSPANEYYDQAIYAGRAGNWRLVASEKGPTPFGAYTTYQGGFSSPSIASNGAVAFASGVGNWGVNSAVFAGLPGALKVIAKSGDPVPGAKDVTFSSFEGAVVNKTGDVVFGATIRYPNEEIRRGIWIQRRTGTPVLIAVDGMSLPTPSGVREAYPFFDGIRSFNDLHQFVFTAQFGNQGERGVYVADTRAVAPWLRPTFPRKPRDRVTREPSITIRGTAQDDTGIEKVEYVVERKGKDHGRMRKTAPRLATGADRWKFKVPLGLGRNRITVAATDKVGNVSDPLVLVILRY